MSIADNPLLKCEDLPRFDTIRPEHVVPAIRKTLQVAEKEFSGLEAQSGGGWEQVMEPLSRIELRLSDVWSPVMHLNGVNNSEALRKAYEAVQGEMVAFGLRMSQSETLYQKFRSLRDGDSWKDFSPAQKRIIDNNIKNAEMSGIGLKAEKRELFNTLTKELTQLSTEFSNNLMDVTKKYGMVLSEISETRGLPASYLSMASQSYNQRYPDASKKSTADKGPWLITLDYPSYVPFMENSQNRKLREELYRAFISRASTDPFDNRPLISEILRKRKKLAGLLGFETYADLSISKKMADSVEKVYGLLNGLKDAAFEPAEKELAALRELAKKSGFKDEIQNWDIAYWAKREQEAKFCFSDEDLRPYFALPNVLEGLFSLVDRLFGISVREADGEATVWHKDVRYYKIFSERGEEIASFFLDPYSRPENKRGGAWMDECKSRHRKKDGTLQLPVAYLICNSTPPVASEPSLLTFREVETLFHEFGHGLQHMLTTVELPEVSGINGIEWDAVELASQFMENWCYHRPTLMSMAKHYQSGEQMPEDLFQKLLASKTFRAGSMMLRQIQVGLVDLELHCNYDPEGQKTPFDIQEEIAKKTSVLPPLKEDHFLCSFSHVFSGGYAAGYYSYKWAEVLSADAFSAFEEAGLDDQKKVAETGRSYRDTILAYGGSLHPMEVFKKFRGREPDSSALLRHSGLGQRQAGGGRL